jgi:2-oxo-hept-3-ene-1,7-dioate hydratase
MSILRTLACGITTAVAVLTLTGIAHAACLRDDVVAKLVEGYPTTPVTGIPDNLSLDDAYCTQAKYVALLEQKMGPPVGYKVGFTGKATQEQFKIASPAMGVLFAPMFVPDGGSLKRDFGHRSLIEPDLMVVVKDEGIMDATTELEAAAHLDTVHAYIELPALQFAQDEKFTGASLVALNLVATKMVQGPGLAVQATPEFVQAMADLETVFTDEKGEAIQSAPGSGLLGNPLKVVLWLVDEMKRQGKVLKTGDRLSLGAVGKLFPLKDSGKTYTYTLKGLPGEPISTSVTVE